MVVEKRVFGKTEQAFVRSGVHEYGMTIQKAQRAFARHLGDGERLLTEDEKMFRLAKSGGISEVDQNTEAFIRTVFNGMPLYNAEAEQVGLVCPDKQGTFAVKIGDEVFYTLYPDPRGIL